LYGSPFLEGVTKLKPPHSLNHGTAGAIVHKVLEDKLEAPSEWITHAFTQLQESKLLPSVTEEVFHDHVSFVQEALANKPYLKAPSFNNNYIKTKMRKHEGASLHDTMDVAGFLDAIIVPLHKARKMDLYTKYGSCKREVRLEYAPTNLPWALTGSADLLLHQPKQSIFIGDYKSGGSGWSESKVRLSPQFNHYAFLTRKMFNEPDTTPVVVTVIAFQEQKEYTVVLGELEAATYRKYLASALEIVEATQRQDIDLPPSDSYLGCPCIVSSMGHCPYKVKKVG
jgi:hypothetical protein